MSNGNYLCEAIQGPVGEFDIAAPLTNPCDTTGSEVNPDAHRSANHHCQS